MLAFSTCWNNSRHTDGEAMIALLHKIGKREGIGDLLADGTRPAAERLGGNCADMLVEVKGVEIPMHDPRAYWSNAVNYAVQGQDASGLAFGERRQTQAPRLDEDVVKLAAKGVRVFIVDDDLRERGIGRDDLVPGVQLVAREELAALLGRYDHVWQW